MTDNEFAAIRFGYESCCQKIVKTYGIDPITVITILLPLIIKLIEQCKEMPASIASDMRFRGLLARRRLTVRIGQYCKEVGADAECKRDLIEATYDFCRSQSQTALRNAITFCQRK